MGVLLASLLLANVAWHRQITPYACGDASVEMVLHSFGGADVDQRAIIDVQRTSNSTGTLSFDVVRGLRFSRISSSDLPGLFPQEAPHGGWAQQHSNGRPSGASFKEGRLGLSAFDFRGTDFGGELDCWTGKLVEMLQRGWPVITLQHYSRASPGGHFRVVTGFSGEGDGSVSSLTMNDPWDRSNAASGGAKPGLPQLVVGSNDGTLRNHAGRDGAAATQPHVITVSRQEFCWRWNHSENNGNVTYAPYFAAPAKPWDVSVDLHADPISGYNGIVTVTYGYPLSQVLPRHENLRAHDVTVELSLPSWLSTTQSQRRSLGELAVGATSKPVRWHLQMQGLPPSEQENDASAVGASAFGTISGSVPFMYCGENCEHRGYSYTDEIGGTGQAFLRPNFVYPN